MASIGPRCVWCASRCEVTWVLGSLMCRLCRPALEWPGAARRARLMHDYPGLARRLAAFPARK